MGQTGANAVVRIVETFGTNGDLRSYTCSGAISISQGALLQLTDARRASLTTDALKGNQIPAGVAYMDKDGTDGSTRITAVTNCIIEAACSGAITLGMPVNMVDGNYVRMVAAVANTTFGVGSYAAILGYALETGSADEVINIRVRV